MAFKCKKLVVIGAGLIGGSLIKALRRERSEIGEIVAVGRNLEVLNNAKNSGYIDQFTDDSATAVINADVVVIGTPVGAMRQHLQNIYPNLNADCVISDVGSVKAHVVNTARQALKEKFTNFVPAHPISGTEHSGFDASFAELFEGRYTILTPVDENSQDDINKIRQLWTAVGSQILELSVENHDKIFAATSHLPHVLVYALVNAISEFDDSEKYFQVVAGGFLDYTRIASSDAIMWRDVCLTNQEPILAMINHYKSKLTELEQMIRTQDGSRLYEQFQQAKLTRDQLVDKRAQEKKDQET